MTPPPSPWRQRLSANLGLLWADLPIPDRIARAAAAGFPAVELHSPGDCPAAVVARACNLTGVRLLGVNSYTGNAAIPGEEAQFREAFSRLAEWCGTAGATAVHVLAGAPSAEARDAARATLIGNIAWAADLVAGAAIGLLLEPINRHARPGYLYHTPDAVAAILGEIGRAGVGMQFDAYHAAMEGIDPIASMRLHLPLIHHVQIAGLPARDEPDSGTVDYARFLATLDDAGYAGWIGCEYHPRDTVEAGLGWRDALNGMAA